MTAVNDLILFSVFFTNIMPSRVHVSISLPVTVTTELARFPGDLPAYPRHVLVCVNARTLKFATLSLDGLLDIVGGEGGDDVARCRLVFPLPPDPVGTHDIMGGDLNVKFLVPASSLTITSVSYAGCLGFSANPDYISAGIHFQLIAFLF